MKEITIGYHNGKRVTIMLMGLLIMAALTFWGYWMIFHSRTIYLYLLIIICMGALAGFYMILMQVVGMMKPDQVALVLNERGIWFKGTSMGRKVGFVDWADVAVVRGDNTWGQKGVYLRLTNDKYYENLNKDAMIKALYEKGLPVLTAEIDVNVDQLEELILKYLKAYREKNQS